MEIKKTKMKKICVYCASSTKIDQVYFEATEQLAELFVNENIEVVFGGGAGGLMGKLADTIIENSGKIVTTQAWAPVESHMKL